MHKEITMAGKKEMDALLSRFVETGPAGCGCIVTKDGERIYENYFGYEDVEAKKPIDADTIYRQYSMTKVIICTAAMKLFEEGKFLLNDPIYEYFPEWKNINKVVYQPNGNFVIRPLENPILVKHVFNMAMGIGYGGNDETHRVAAEVRKNLREKYGKYYTLRQDIEAMSAVPVAFEPGSHWLYGFGHELVAGLIEVCSGKKVSEYLQENIFDPLGMNSTAYRLRGDMANHLVVPYTRNADGSLTRAEAMMEENIQPDAVYEAGGAGIISTVPDYSKFVSTLANRGIMPNGEQLISRQTQDLMRDNMLTDTQLGEFRNFYLDGYGYGLGVRTLMGRAIAHSNGTPGAYGWTGALGTYTEISPEENFSITYMHQAVPNMEEYHHLRVRAVAYSMIK